MRADPRSGVLSSLRRIAETAADMASSRIELASIEVGEAIERILRSLIVAFMAVLLIAAGLVALSALLVFLVDESHRSAVLVGMGVVYLVLGVGMLAWLRNDLRSWPLMFAATLAELRRDTRVLRGGDDVVAGRPGPAQEDA